MSCLTIGQLARQAHVNVETIRYYERRGLIAEPARNEAGYRQYSADFVARIRFIKRAQSLGFSLREIGELLALRVESRAACEQVQQRAEAKIASIEAKIHALQNMQQTLVRLVAACENNELTGDCPILDALDMHGEKKWKSSPNQP